MRSPLLPGVFVAWDDDGYFLRQCPTCLRRFGARPSYPDQEAYAVHHYHCPYCRAAAKPAAWNALRQDASRVGRGKRTVRRPSGAELYQEAVVISEIIDEVFGAHEELDGAGLGPIIASPCHPNEPVKLVPRDAAEAFCLVCGATYVWRENLPAAAAERLRAFSPDQLRRRVTSHYNDDEKLGLSDDWLVIADAAALMSGAPQEGLGVIVSKVTHARALLEEDHRHLWYIDGSVDLLLCLCDDQLLRYLTRAYVPRSWQAIDRSDPDYHHEHTSEELRSLLKELTLEPSITMRWSQAVEGRRTAQAPDTSDDELRTLAASNDWLTRVLVAGSPKAPADALDKLARDTTRSVVQAVAVHPSAPASALNVLAGHESWQVRGYVAQHTGTPRSTLAQLARDVRAEVRRSAGRNAATPAASLERLSQDPDLEIRAAVASNAATPPMVLRRLHHAEVRAGESSLLGAALAANPGCPYGMMAALISGTSAAEDRLANPRQQILRALGSNPRLPMSLAAQVLDKAIAAGSSLEERLGIVWLRNRWSVEEECSEVTRLFQDWLDPLTVSQAVSLAPAMSPGAVRALRDHLSAEVRQQVARREERRLQD